MNYLKISCMLFLSLSSPVFCMFTGFKKTYSATKFVWAHKKKIAATLGSAELYRKQENKTIDMPLPVKLALSACAGPLLTLKDHYIDQSIDTFFIDRKDRLQLIYQDFKRATSMPRIKEDIVDAILRGDTKSLNKLLGSSIDEKSLVLNLYSLECEKKKIGFARDVTGPIKPYFLHNDGQIEYLVCTVDCTKESKLQNEPLLKYACDKLVELDAQAKIDTSVVEKTLLLLTAYSPSPESIAPCSALIVKINKQVEEAQKAAHKEKKPYESVLFKTIKDFFK